jgi:hypothetical protein
MSVALEDFLEVIKESRHLDVKINVLGEQVFVNVIFKAK